MKKLFYLTFFVLFSILLISCDTKKKNNTKVLKTCFHNDPTSLDPRRVDNYITSQLHFMLFKGLMHYTSDKKLECCLAKSYKVSNDKKVYTFYLRDDIYWSDNKKITAKDFEKSWKTSLSPDFPAHFPSLFYPIKNAEKAKTKKCLIDEVKITALDDKTFEVELENPCPYFLFLTSFSNFFPIPSHLNDDEWNKCKDSSFVTCGPFNLKKWTNHSEMILEKNQTYFNKDKINIDGIHIYIIPEEQTAFQMYENKEVDFLSSFTSPIDIDTLGTIKKRDDVNLIPIGGMSFLTFNTKKFPFNNKNIRKAISLAIDRSSIVKNISQLGEKIAERCIPPVIDNDNTIKLFKGFDANLANEYLEKGLSELNNIKAEDLTVSLIYGSYKIHKKEAESIKQMLEKTLKIKVKLVQSEDKIILTKLAEHDYQMGLARLIVHYDDAMNILERFKDINLPKNYPHWENLKYISLLNNANAEVDLEKRRNYLLEAEKILIEEHPIAPLYFYNYLIINQSDVSGIYINAAGDLLFDETKISR
ncbi:MAG: peptide ABC transporter substrate-binding protein [Parachlamydiales bacterium]|nr:peptide ABC transporter substrate-binding protein [Parachlamydiales bacterium]